jgi:DNA repair exonuclease SbcCD ATPase subunit
LLGERDALAYALREAEERLAQEQLTLEAAKIERQEAEDLWALQKVDLIQNLSFSEQKIQDLSADLIRTQANQDQMHEKIVRLEGECKDALTEIERQHNEIDRLTHDLAAAREAEDQVLMLKGELTKAQARQEQAEANVHTWKLALEEANRDFRLIESNHEARVASATKHVNDLLGQIEGQADELHQARNIQRQRDEELRQAWSLHERSSNEVQSLTEQIDRLQSTWDDERSQMQSEIKKFEKEILDNIEVRNVQEVSFSKSKDILIEHIVDAISNVNVSWIFFSRSVRRAKIKKLIDDSFGAANSL